MSAHPHPQAVSPELVRGLGTIWIDRGLPYWRRRVLWSLLFFLFFAIGAGGSAGFIIAFLRSHAPIPVRVILIAVSGCVIVGTAFFTFRSVRKQERSNEPRSKMGPLGLNLAFGGSALRLIVNTVIGALMLICFFYLMAGGWLVIFLLSLRPVLPDEAQARRRLQILQTHPEPAPGHRPAGEPRPYPSQTTKRRR